MKNKILIFILLISFFSCKKETPISEVSDFGYPFFPIKIGDSAFYQVQKITWDDFDQTIDTSSYLLCEFIESVSTNYIGDSLYRIERMKRNSNSDPWNFDSTWFALKNKHEALRVENNITFVKIVFPIFENQTWNGNIYNLQGEKRYTSSFISAIEVSGITYSNALKIQQQDFESIINSDIETEYYAHSVGLIQATKLHVYKIYNPESGQFEISSGYSYTQNRIR